MNQHVVIEVSGVHKSFKQVHAVKGVDIRVLGGEFVAILGPNGAGKTTLVEMIEGIQKPDKGEIHILGKKWQGNEDELHHVIGLSLQETNLIGKLRVSETLDLFASFYGLRKDRIREIIEMVGLEEKQKAWVSNLSGGQRQRLALGIALLNKPRILLLDEPTTGLDPNARRELWAVLLKLKQEADTSMILTTHYMEEAEKLCDRIIIMDQGLILKEGPLNVLLNDSLDEKIIEFTLQTDPERTSMLTGNGFNVQWDPQHGKGTARLSHFEKELPELLAYLSNHGLHLDNFECRRKTLDDVFISLTGKHLHE